MNNGLFLNSNHRCGHFALLVTAAAALFFVNLGGPSLWDVDEGRNSTATQEMVGSRNWVKPTFNGELRVDKPVLLYWLQAGAYQVFGINEFSARLPSALAALLTVLVCYELGRRLFSPASGLLAGLVTASTPMFCAAARFANPDALLNFFTVLALFFFWRGYYRPGWFWFVSVGMATGLAVLAKGPIGLLLPLGVIGLFLLWNRQLHLLWDRRLWLGFLVFCLVALPWYVCVAVETKGEFVRGFIMNHNVDRLLQPKEDHHGSAFYYPVVLFLGFAPWSFFLGLAGWYASWSLVLRPWSRVRDIWRRAADGASAAGGFETNCPDTPPTTPAYRLLASWIAVYLVFFSLAATKLPNYVLPVYVPLALLTGRFLDRWRQGAIRPPAWTLQATLCGLALTGLAAGFGLMLAGGMVHLPFMRDRYVHGIEPWAFMGLVPVVGAALAFRNLRRQNPTGVIASVAAAVILFVGPIAAWALVALNNHKAPRPLVERAGACQRYREVRIGCWKLEYLPSLNFYCQRAITHYQTEEQVLDFLRYPVPVFLFLPEPCWQQLQMKVHSPHRVLSRHHDMYRACQVVVVTNQVTVGSGQLAVGSQSEN